MDTVIHSDAGSLDRLAGPWRALWNSDTSAGAFLTPEYLSTWLPEFGSDHHPTFVEVRDGNDLFAIAALGIDPDGVLRFLGDREVTDYFGPVCAPENREVAATAIIEAATSVEWETAELLGLRPEWTEALARAGKAAGHEVEERQQDVCPVVELSGSYEEYLAALDGKLRHEIRRKARKLEREAGPYVIRLSDRSTLHADLEHFFAMHRSSDGPKGHFLHWGMGGFFTLLARTFDAKGWLRLSFLEIEGEPLAAVFSFCVGGTWSVYNSAFDHAKRDLGAGMVLMAETIALACAEGCSSFDLLRGDEPYKYRFGATDTPVMQLTLRRTR